MLSYRYLPALYWAALNHHTGDYVGDNKYADKGIRNEISQSDRHNWTTPTELQSNQL